MLLIDSNDFLTQVRLKQRLRALESEKRYYEEKIGEVKEERRELLSDRKHLEKFARERYLMRKKTEDLYIIVEEE